MQKPLLNICATNDNDARCKTDARGAGNDSTDRLETFSSENNPSAV